MIVFGEEGFRRELGHGGGTLMNRISVLIKETPERFLTLPPYQDTAKRQLPRSQALMRHRICQCFGLPRLQICEK